MLLAHAGEVAIKDLPAGWQVRVDGQVATHGDESRGLASGTHSVLVLDAKERVQSRHTVLLFEDERVEIDIRQMVNPEVFRGKVGDHAEVSVADLPATVDVIVLERAVRILVDGRPMAFDDEVERFSETLPHGPHRLQATINARVRSAVTVEVAGRPWHCTASPAGVLACTVVQALDALPDLQVDELLERIKAMAPARRVRELTDTEGRTSCAGLGRLLDELADDKERLVVIRAFRPRIIDPWNYAALQQRVSFVDSQSEVEALYKVTKPTR